MDSTEARALILMLDALRLEIRATEPITGWLRDDADARAKLALALTDHSGSAWDQVERINAAKRALTPTRPAETPIDSP